MALGPCTPCSPGAEAPEAAPEPKSTAYVEVEEDATPVDRDCELFRASRSACTLNVMPTTDSGRSLGSRRAGGDSRDLSIWHMAGMA